MSTSYPTLHPKVQEKVWYRKLRNDVREIISTLCKYKDVEIIDGVVCEDHIHLSVIISPKIRKHTKLHGISEREKYADGL